MLLDCDSQLLTAYVDDELTTRQRRHLEHLLRRSPEARQLLHKLQADARTLRHLPRPPLPADLSGPVLRAIAARRLAPRHRRIIKVSAPPPWVGPLASWAAAAAVLLVLGAASYLYFASSLSQPAATEVAQKESEPPIPAPSPLPLHPGPAKEERTQPTRRPQPRPKINRSVAVNPPHAAKQRRDKPKAVAPKNKPTPPKPETALTERLDLFQLDRVPDMLPLVITVSDLEQGSPRKELIAALRKDNAFRMELPCANGTKALERVQSAARRLHFGLILDKQAQERIKRKWRSNYFLYLENVTPEELTHFVRQIGKEDRRLAAKKPAETQIDRLVLTPLTTRHRKELSTLLGIDPTNTAPAATGPLGTDLRKPLSDSTARQLEKALAGQGGTPRAKSGKPAAKSPEHLALLLAYNLVHPSPGSDEIKRFLESRKPARPGTIRVLLILRS